MKKLLSTQLILLCCAALFAFWQCEAPTKGCLDTEASNLSLSADKPCEDDCCTYPNLMVVFEQVVGDEVWRPDSVYFNDLGKPFVLKAATFYFSDMAVSQQGTPYTISDSVSMRVFNGTDTVTQYFYDDFILTRRVPLEYTVGTFKQSGFFEVFQAKLGLNPDANQIVPSKTPSGHPLGKQPDSLWLGNSERFAWMMLAIKRDSAAAAPIDTLRFTAADFGQPFPVEGTSQWEHVKGSDFKITVTADFAKLFAGVDFANFGVSQIKTKVLSNLSNTFEVK